MLNNITAIFARISDSCFGTTIPIIINSPVGRAIQSIRRVLRQSTERAIVI